MWHCMICGKYFERNARKEFSWPFNCAHPPYICPFCRSSRIIVMNYE